MLVPSHELGEYGPSARFRDEPQTQAWQKEVRQGVRIWAGPGFTGRIAAELQPVVLDRENHTTVLNPIQTPKGIYP